MLLYCVGMVLFKGCQYFILFLSLRNFIFQLPGFLGVCPPQTTLKRTQPETMSHHLFYVLGKSEETAEHNQIN